MNLENKLSVLVIGSGLIGQSWTSLFISCGHSVMLYDNNPEHLGTVEENIGRTLSQYQREGCLRGHLTIDEQIKFIKPISKLEDVLRKEKIDIIIECVFEKVEVKAKVFELLDSLVDEEVILASSSSCIATSQYCENLNHRSQCLVAHPVNPPYLLRLVEIVPNEWTSKSLISRCRRVMESIGQKPIVFAKEIPGFGVNRLQYALINQAWDLVQQGILSVEDVDKIVTEGLGPRWAFYGPMSVIQLNADGFQDYMNRYKNGMLTVSSSMGQTPNFDSETIGTVAQKMNEIMPMEELNDFREQRNKLIGEVFKTKLKYE